MRVKLTNLKVNMKIEKTENVFKIGGQEPHSCYCEDNCQSVKSENICGEDWRRTWGVDYKWW